MLRRPAFVLVLLFAATVTAGAQTPTPGSRVIGMPDTMGANFPVSDSLTGTSAATDYDFLVGMWTFTFQGRNSDGKFGQPFTGHWLVTSKQTGGQGVMIEDHWRDDDPSATWEAGTWTYRVWNPARRHWEMEGINIAHGVWQPGTMWSDGNDRVLIEWYGTMLVRFRYFAIDKNKFLWRADATNDGGKTWIRDYWTMEAHRIAR